VSQQEKKLTLKVEDLKRMIQEAIEEQLKPIKEKFESTMSNEDWFKHIENCPHCQEKLKSLGWEKIGKKEERKQPTFLW
jgi:hypothetical protein